MILRFAGRKTSRRSIALQTESLRLRATVSPLVVGANSSPKCSSHDASHMLQRVQSDSNVGFTQVRADGLVEEPMRSVFDQGEAP